MSPIKLKIKKKRTYKKYNYMPRSSDGRAGGGRVGDFLPVYQNWQKRCSVVETDRRIISSTDIDGLDEETVNVLRDRAKATLTTQALAKEELLEGNKPADDLLNLEGLENHLAYVLASMGILTLEDLAEHFEIPEVPDVATTNPEGYNNNLARLRQIEAIANGENLTEPLKEAA